MTTAEIVVTLVGLAAIAWVNYYFFFAGRGVAAAAMPGAGGPQTVRVTVQGGYSPAVVLVQAGSPVRMEFDRRETSSCTEEVVISDFGIRTFLPPHTTTAVEFTPARPGEYEFACGMGMVRGKIIARPAASDGKPA